MPYKQVFLICKFMATKVRILYRSCNTINMVFDDGVLKKIYYLCAEKNKQTEK